MTSHTIKHMVAACAVAMLFGCETVPELIDQSNDTGHTTAGLDYRDFNRAADDSVKELLASGAVNRPGRPYALVVSRILNKTTEVVDTDLLIKRIRVALMRAGKVQVTTAWGIAGPEDKMTALVQEEVGSPDTTVKPELSLSGKIIEPRQKCYDSSTNQQEFHFQLTLTDLNTGLSVWEDERKVVKRVSSKTVTW